MIRQHPYPERPQGCHWLRRMLLVLLIVYPFALHLGVMNEQMQPALSLLLGLLLISGLLILSKGSRYGWLLLALAMAGSLWFFVYHVDPEPLLRLPPVMVNGILCFLFGYTLLPGKQPMIGRFAEIIHERALDEQTLQYTRGITRWWTLLFAFLTLESLLLGLLAGARIWSLFTNFINYLVVLLMFFLEYRLRLRRLPHLDHPGFTGFLLALRRIDWRRLW